MRLPNPDKIIIPKEKLTDYLLSVTHPIGKSKAQFLGFLGFDESKADLIEKEIRGVAEMNDIIEEKSTNFGMKYIINGRINAPNGDIVEIKTVWILETGKERPRFVTLYPVKYRKEGL